MMAAPQLLQRPVMLATKLSSPLPSTAPIHQVRIVNGQPCSKTGTAPLTGIVITTPVSAAPTRLASPAQPPNPIAVPTAAAVQPIQISSLGPEPKVRKVDRFLIRSVEGALVTGSALLLLLAACQTWKWSGAEGCGDPPLFIQPSFVAPSSPASSSPAQEGGEPRGTA